ncbi:MAG: sigma 54-interacting transcriptional regulator [Spirochaetaceae bacterium]|jgi:PAS domain S-box-containing protein|nr:sigma 54-interacting transcriptional regulator [Spirochaetaceae bacterium]
MEQSILSVFGTAKTGSDSILEKLFHVLNSSFDGIYITDGEANTLFANNSYEVITGLKREEVIGKNMRELVDTKVMNVSGSLLVLESRSPVTLDQKFRTGKHAIITSTPVFDRNGKITMIITNVRDVTELYRVKQQLAQKEELSQRQMFELELIRSQNTGGKYDYNTNDPKMFEVLHMLTRIAKTDTTVLLQGETGVGKEAFASYIHQNSARSRERFITINCAAISEQLVESELFGYAPGSFTGASESGKPGLFEIADKGTVFLDEVGELPLTVQVKLLRVLHDQSMLPVGATEVRRVDVRIIAATNRDLKKMVQQQRFRQDLLYRLNTFTATIPPLRDRRSDIIPLALFILQNFNKQHHLEKTLSESACLELYNYHWPGNIREMRNVIERAVILSDGSEIYPDDLAISETVRHRSDGDERRSSGKDPVNLKFLLEKIEGEYIKSAFDRHRSIRRAAAHLTMDPATYLRKWRKYTE